MLTDEAGSGGVLAIVKRMRTRLMISAFTLTLLGKCSVLVTCEVLVNALFWIVSAIVFRRIDGEGSRALSLALVAWTTGLRHGLDADHISAIDNATRRIVSASSNETDNDAPQIRRPVTVGLFFSLGHSTVVFATTVAIAISADVANHLDGYASIGGIIGASISSSFLILIGCINSFILYKTWQRLREAKREAALRQKGGGEEEKSRDEPRFNGMITRMAMPVLRSVDRPWKMFPVGLLFGLGFDTASTIALLSVSVIALQSSQGGSQSNAKVILFALLFTAGMTLVDSLDSCLMIWAYAPDDSFGGRKRFNFYRKTDTQADMREQDLFDAIHHPNDRANGKNLAVGSEFEAEPCAGAAPKDVICQETILDSTKGEKKDTIKGQGPSSQPNVFNVRNSTLDVSASRISLLLTLLSIMVAFAIGFIVLLGLIGDECGRCSAAADRQEESGSGGLEGRWWLFWRQANDNSGYVGAGIVGLFALIVVGYYLIRWIRRRFFAEIRTQDACINTEV